MRPCEDVIVISDHEEGEITDSDSTEDDNDHDQIPNKIVSPQVQPHLRSHLKIHKKPVQPPPRLRAAAKCPPSFQVAPSRFTAAFRPGTRFLRRYVPPKIPIRSGSVYRFKEIYRGSVPRKYVPNSPFSSALRKFQSRKRKLSSCSDHSDTENIPRKITMPEKKNNSSLKSRVTNMIKFNSAKIKVKTGNKTNKDSDLSSEVLDNEDSLSVSEKKSQQSTHSDLYEKLSDIENTSDDDPDILRELALKSKTQRVLQNKMNDNAQPEFVTGENTNILNEEEMDVPGDREIQELRMAALKSAMLKRAIKRKRMKPITRKKRKSVSVSVYDSFEETIGNKDSILEHLNSEDKTDYNKYMYNVPDPLFDSELLKSPCPIFENDSKNSIENDDDDNDESEEMLRIRLLASMKSNNKNSAPLAPKPKESIMEKDLDSSLIIRLGDSESESDCEMTKNLAIMHKKLKEQNDFQRNLDLYLKGAREVTEKKSKPSPIKIDAVHSTIVDKTGIKNLSQARQLEYYKLMKRMNEIEQSKRPLQTLTKNSTVVNKRNVFNVNQSNSASAIENTSLLKLNSFKRDMRVIAKSSINTNRRVYVNENDIRSQPTNTKVFEQQLISIRKKITKHLEVIENQRIAMNSYQAKKDSLERQIKAANAVLLNTNKAILLKQRDQNNSLRMLNQLRKYQAIIQNRLTKNVVRKNAEIISPRKLTIKVDNTNCDRLGVSNSKTVVINKNIESNVSESQSTIKNDINNIQHKTATTLMDNSSSEHSKSRESVSIENISNKTVSTNQMPLINNVSIPETVIIHPEHRIVQNTLVDIKIKVSNDNQDANVSNDLNKNIDATTKESDTDANGSNVNLNENDASFAEYDSPLMRFKVGQSWPIDPQGILCPFDVSGCCKDLKCNYIHSKDVNMAN